MVKPVQRSWLFAAAVLVVYAAGPRMFGQGYKLAAFGDIVQCGVGLVLVAAGWANVRRGTSEVRKFWTLMASSFTLWVLGQFIWTYYEVYLEKEVPRVFL